MMKSCSALQQWQCLALHILLQCITIIRAAPSPVCPLTPLQIGNGGLFNTTLLLPQTQRPPDLPKDPFDIRHQPIPGEGPPTLTTEIYCYSDKLDIEETYQAITNILVDIDFDYWRIHDRPIGKSPLVYVRKYVTVVFHPREQTTWNDWHEAVLGLRGFWWKRNMDQLEGFTFHFLLIKDGDDDHLGMGVFEATPPKPKPSKAMDQS